MSDDFLSLWDAGYTDLIPVIPPDAELSPYSNVNDGARGKSPGLRYDNGWGGFDWIHEQATRDKCERWQGWGASVGMVCRRVIAFDIDVTDEETSEAIAELVRSRLGWAAERIGRAPKQLLVYGLPWDDPAAEAGGVKWRRLRFEVNGTEHAVEVLGKGRQFVVGGVHPATGRAYYWPEPLPYPEPPSKSLSGPERLTAVPEDEIDAVLEEIGELVEFVYDGEVLSGGVQTEGSSTRSPTAQGALKGEDLAELERICDMIPNTSEIFPSRDDYIKVASAFKAAFADDEGRGFWAWWRWCEKWEGGNDLDTAKADWKRLYPPFGVGAHYLYDLARQHGGYNREAAAKVFTPVESDEDDDDEEQAKAELVREFFGRYAYINEIERFFDLERKRLLSHSQFSVQWATRVGDGTTGKKGAAMRYLNDKRRQVFDGLTYRPLQGDFVHEDEGEGLCVNTWRPGPAHTDWQTDEQRSDDDVRPYLELVEALVPDERERKIMLDWLAWQVQYPGRKLNWHLLVWGPQGVGKDTLLVPVRRGLGRNAGEIQAQQLSDPWTYWLENKSLIVVEEINTFERRTIADKLKQLLSVPPETVEITQKYVPGYRVPNVANYVFLSNHPDAVVLEQADRRFFVVAAPQHSQLPAEFFTRIYSWFENMEGNAAVCQWLAQRDLSEIEGWTAAPATQAKEEMKSSSLGLLEGTLLEAIETESGPFRRDLLTASEIRDYLARECPEAVKRMSPQKVAMAVKGMGLYNFEGRNFKVDGRRERIWAVRRLDTYRQYFDPDSPGEIVQLYHDQQVRAQKEEQRAALGRG